MATASGIECATRTKPIRKPPIWTGSSSGLASFSSTAFRSPCSSSRDWGEAEREPRAPDLRNRDLAEQIGKRADVILVRVREDDRANPILSFGEVGHVREDQADAEVLVPGKCQPGVDNDDVVVELVDGHVLADLADTAERDDPKRLPSHEVDSTADPGEGLAEQPAAGVRCSFPDKDAGSVRIDDIRAFN